MRAALVASALSWAGCAGAPVPRPSPGPGPELASRPDVRMGVLEIVATRDVAGGHTFELRDADAVFVAATDAHRRGELGPAIGLYRELLARFESPGHELAARYNLGMALEESGDCPAALAEYEAVLAVAQDSGDIRDTLFRKAGCLTQAGRNDEAAATLEGILSLPGLPGLSRYEALVRRAEVDVRRGRLDEAEDTFRVVVTRARPRPGPRADPAEADEVLQPGPLLARSHLGLARVLRRRMDAIPLRLPLDVMETDLHAKVEAFKRAQTAYLRAVRHGVPGMTAAAGLELGEMYEALCDDLLEAPHPADFTAEEVAVYYEELLKEVRPLLEQAVYVYEKNLGTAERLGAGDDDRHVAATRERLAQLGALLATSPQSLYALRSFLARRPSEVLPPPGAVERGPD